MKNRGRKLIIMMIMNEQGLQFKPLPPDVYTSSAHILDVQIFLTN
jgi:hypothetical protein